jgi:hypothetical protein
MFGNAHLQLDSHSFQSTTGSRPGCGASRYTCRARGEVTGGGAHPVRGQRIDDRFTIGVPFAKAVNPVTKTNWEGTGVKPDVAVAASEALTTAQKLASDKLTSLH